MWHACAVTCPDPPLSGRGAPGFHGTHRSGQKDIPLLEEQFRQRNDGLQCSVQDSRVHQQAVVKVIGPVGGEDLAFTRPQILEDLETGAVLQPQTV
ncbi:hypothetical protein NOGI109294_16595 [Nocardiopsis gilva]